MDAPGYMPGQFPPDFGAVVDGVVEDDGGVVVVVGVSVVVDGAVAVVVAGVVLPLSVLAA
jgi:hypothetical protein